LSDERGLSGPGRVKSGHTASCKSPAPWEGRPLRAGEGASGSREGGAAAPNSRTDCAKRSPPRSSPRDPPGGRVSCVHLACEVSWIGVRAAGDVTGGNGCGTAAAYCRCLLHSVRFDCLESPRALSSFGLQIRCCRFRTIQESREQPFGPGKVVDGSFNRPAVCRFQPMRPRTHRRDAAPSPLASLFPLPKFSRDKKLSPPVELRLLTVPSPVTEFPSVTDVSSVTELTSFPPASASPAVSASDPARLSSHRSALAVGG